MWRRPRLLLHNPRFTAFAFYPEIGLIVSLSDGTRLGAYEIIGQIGVGGMGVVYRARDTDLKREVAIKTLPASLVGDADRLARFRREAEVLASLNHPDIAQIYGLEKSGGTMALVTEYVEGPTLADRIERGPLPADEALDVAMQIAEALEAAHLRGIVHRDLKPANVKLSTTSRPTDAFCSSIVRRKFSRVRSISFRTGSTSSSGSCRRADKRTLLAAGRLVPEEPMVPPGR